MPTTARYLTTWLLSTVALVGLVALANFIVDPYGLFRIVDVAGLNRIKSQASERGATFKHAGVARMRPKALVLGNSRAEIGFDPDSPAWPTWARPVFNLAIPGAGIGAVAGDFAKALDRTSPRLVVVGLDFVDFRVDPAANDRFTLPGAPADRLEPLRERASALLTMNSLADSLATVRAQHDPYPAGLTEAGFNPKLDYVGIARREGYFAMFRQRDQENALAYLRGPKSAFQASGRPAPAFDAVDSIIENARSRGTTLRLVLYPYHAHTLMLFHLTGLWPAYEDWKRELVRRIDSARGSMDIELWDFTGFSPQTGEAVPGRGDTRTELQWYWEAGHFKKSLGDMLLAEMFAGSKDGRAWGRRLTAGNLDEALHQQRVERDEYETHHSADVAELRTLVAAAAKKP